MFEFWEMYFPISGVKTSLWIPPLVAFVVSVFTSMAGISGGFLLLPFQMSYLHFTSPSVNSTNFVYNLVAIPSGVYRYIKEGRMAWPITWVVILGTLPGVFWGYQIRVQYFPDPRSFKLFVGFVLLYIGIRMLYEVLPSSEKRYSMKELDAKFQEMLKQMQQAKERGEAVPSKPWVKTIVFSIHVVEYEFLEQRFRINTFKLLALAFIVGIVGGTYGIGGGALIAPICVSIFHLPIHTIAGAALLGTFLTSVAGIVFYTWIPAINSTTWPPDWSLGILFGLGGFLGMYCGARLQKFVPRKVLHSMLGLLVLILAVVYIGQYFY